MCDSSAHLFTRCVQGLDERSHRWSWHTPKWPLSHWRLDQLHEVLHDLTCAGRIRRGVCTIETGPDAAAVVSLWRIFRQNALVLWRDERFQDRRFMDSWFNQYGINSKRLQFKTVAVGKSFKRKLRGGIHSEVRSYGPTGRGAYVDQQATAVAAHGRQNCAIYAHDAE